jgi:xanthine/CO dehydrogenase XdhC/CoxF family maturation factor
VLRLTAQLADLRGSASAAALAVVQAELTAATVAGGCLAEELTAAEHACRSTQVSGPTPLS